MGNKSQPKREVKKPKQDSLRGTKRQPNPVDEVETVREAEKKAADKGNPYHDHSKDTSTLKD